MVILVLLTFFRAIAAGETRYTFHLILMSKVGLENKFCEKSGALPRTINLSCNRALDLGAHHYLPVALCINVRSK